MLEEEYSIAIIFCLCGLGLIYGIYKMIEVLTITPKVINPKEKSEDENLLIEEGETIFLSQRQFYKLEKICRLILVEQIKNDE